ncbi:MAG: hypothetical protein P8L85_08360 [Rubripirellula sp.]|nr:hypothetical protein [Rubripirellula sp.]
MALISNTVSFALSRLLDLERISERGHSRVVHVGFEPPQQRNGSVTLDEIPAVAAKHSCEKWCVGEKTEATRAPAKLHAGDPTTVTIRFSFLQEIAFNAT